MTSRSPDPELHALSEELTHLGRLKIVCGVYVFDAWLSFVCAARMVDPISLELVQEAIRAAVRTPLQRGGKVDAVLPCGDGTVFIRSFEGIYVLVVRFKALADQTLPPDAAEVVRAASLLALPTIGRLTRALPPDDPGPGSAEGFGAA